MSGVGGDDSYVEQFGVMDEVDRRVNIGMEFAERKPQGTPEAEVLSWYRIDGSPDVGVRVRREPTHENESAYKTPLAGKTHASSTPVDLHPFPRHRHPDGFFASYHENILISPRVPDRRHSHEPLHANLYTNTYLYIRSMCTI